MLFRLSLILLALPIFSQDITGFWKSYNEKTQKPQIMVAVYPYEGKYYGRIVAIYNKKGEIEETIYKPNSKAPGIVGNPFYCGLDMIYNLKNKQSIYYGKIVDPEKGNVYSAELRKDNQDLIVRGKLFVFGKNMTWLPAIESEFSDAFPKPDIKHFIPMIPKCK